jgi:hypothetical protein
VKATHAARKGIDRDSLKHVPVMRLPPGYKNWDEWFEEQHEEGLLEGAREGLRRLREKGKT